MNEYLVVYLTIFLYKLFFVYLHSIDARLCSVPIDGTSVTLSSPNPLYVTLDTTMSHKIWFCLLKSGYIWFLDTANKQK